MPYLDIRSLDQLASRSLDEAKADTGRQSRHAIGHVAADRHIVGVAGPERLGERRDALGLGAEDRLRQCAGNPRRAACAKVGHPPVEAVARYGRAAATAAARHEDGTRSGQQRAAAENDGSSFHRHRSAPFIVSRCDRLIA
ncbi:hypothetical protein ABIE78_004285 [Sinorhizobium fredii]